MKEIYELDIYKLAENLSDLIWYAFDDWSDKVKKNDWLSELNAYIRSTKINEG